MPIGKKPKKQRIATDRERAAEQFIAAASEPAAEPRKVTTTLRFDAELLARIDAAAKRRGVSRSAWILYNLSRALEEGNG
ncbi:MAG TPA: CopG family transcriptional regulator [Candidatus Competibacter sp.]|nr:CopG family transcriptional regulator [Candidatus Competibacter sp.]